MHWTFYSPNSFLNLGQRFNARFVQYIENIEVSYCSISHIHIEPIEISKEYSTPKSKEFINGILDKFIKDILQKKEIES